MRWRLALVALALGGTLLGACSGESPQIPAADSTLEVLIHWDDQGIAQKRVEVLELGLEALTDADGLARFTLPAGAYTLRAYEINRGGPGLLHVDQPVTTRSGETTQVEIEDCLPCV